MNLADMMEGLQRAATHKTKFCNITLTQMEIAPILSEYNSLRAEVWQLKTLIHCLLDNDPNDLAADGGITVLDVWRKDASRILKRTT